MSNPSQPPELARALLLSEDLRAAFKGIVRQMRRDTARQDSGLSLMQTMLLQLIDEHPGIGVAELARMQGVRSPTMSGQVKALETAGVIARSAPRAEDRRRSALAPTPAGQDVLRRLRAQRIDWLAQRVARLAPAQMDSLAAAIDALDIIGQHED